MRKKLLFIHLKCCGVLLAPYLENYLKQPQPEMELDQSFLIGPGSSCKLANFWLNLVFELTF